MKQLKQWMAKPMTRGWYLMMGFIVTVMAVMAGMVYWIVYFTEIPERIKNGWATMTRNIFRKRIPVDKNVQEKENHYAK